METILVITAASFIASGVGTLAGFGTSTVMVPVLLLFLPFHVTLLLVGIVHWFTDIWKMLLFRSGLRWRLILGFAGVGMFAAWVGARVTFAIPEGALSRAVGAFILAYVALIAFRPAFKVPLTRSTSVLGGASYGLVSGVTGIGGEIRTVFLSAYDLPKAAFLFTSGAIGFFVDSTRIASYVMGGARLPETLALGLLVFVPASFLGSLTAKRLVDRIPQRKFRAAVASVLLLVGLKLALLP